MTIEEHIKHWIDSAEDDLAAAEDLYIAKRYNWCLFIGHLVLEKALKANYVKVNENKTPPKIHNLLKLAELSKINLTQEKTDFFDDVNRFQIDGRYNEFKNEFYKIATKEFAEINLSKIKDDFQWLKSLIKL